MSEVESTPEVAVTVMSFGFKFGLPADAGWVVDARMVRNPFWVPELRSFTGLDIPVRDYVLADEVARELIDHTHSLMSWSLRRYADRDRDTLRPSRSAAPVVGTGRWSSSKRLLSGCAPTA